MATVGDRDRSVQRGRGDRLEPRRPRRARPRSAHPSNGGDGTGTTGGRGHRVLRTLGFGIPVLLVAFGLMQLVPYRISNPATRQEPKWDSAQTRKLAVAACFACHSNEVKKPWYAQVAPVSWWLTNHVNDGRAALNFSDWAKHHGETGDLTEVVQNGSMPPSYFTWFGLHPEAKLTKAQRDALAQGLRKTAQQSGGGTATGG